MEDTKDVEIAQLKEALAHTQRLLTATQAAADQVITAPLCWCGAATIWRQWCRTHAPRCVSGAHFHGNCQCAGEPTLAVLRRMQRAQDNLRALLTACQLAIRMATIQGAEGTLGLALLDPTGAGHVCARFEAPEFLKDLAIVVGEAVDDVTA